MNGNILLSPVESALGAGEEGALTVSVRRREPWHLQNSDLAVAAGYGNDPRWLRVLQTGLHQMPLRIEARCGDRVVGVLPLALVESRLFGRFLVSLPYLNSAGVLAGDEYTARLLIDRAVELADEFDVRYLELRQETEVAHPALTFSRSDKVNMRLELPDTADELWSGLKAKVRNQVKKARSHELNVVWGRDELLPGFYRVFSRNMRDLGTPVYGRELFASILDVFGDAAEFCVVSFGNREVAGALLIHGDDATQVPSASSLRTFNHLNANMLMYWHLLERAVQRGSRVFDFGRSSEDSGTYRFKKQWGATPSPSVWQYYLRRGDADDMRPQSAKNQRLIRIWQRLPVWLTRLIGPRIVRGIP